MKDEEYREKVKKTWGISELPSETYRNQIELHKSRKLKNAFVFGEDPIGCAIEKEDIHYLFENIDFLVVQDYFLTETAKQATLILPASFPVEMGGSYSNTQKTLQRFRAGIEKKIEKDNIMQLQELLKNLGVSAKGNVEEVFEESMELLPKEQHKKLLFRYTEKNNYYRMFDFGCDSLVKYFEESFVNAFNN